MAFTYLLAMAPEVPGVHIFLRDRRDGDDPACVYVEYHSGTDCRAVALVEPETTFQTCRVSRPGFERVDFEGVLPARSVVLPRTPVRVRQRLRRH